MTIASVVEGEGELSALPTLLRRLTYEAELWDANILKPYRVGRDSLVKQGGIEVAVEALADRVPADGPGGILVVLDADDDCPATLGPSLLERAMTARPDRRTAVVLAQREFEAWFLAAAPTLGGCRGMPHGLDVPPDCEAPRDCKGWLTHHRADGRPYKPAVDQAALSEVFGLAMARANSPSFEKFCRDVHYLMTGKRGA
ncbi:DUF4276 family protein [Streptomyces sp. NPDC002908]|uniref:DUF4276 family protein n=1 Tax=Streptomyces sp. NPDC002908 TaxID=3364670 RepID=UPI0036A51EEB